MQRLPNNDFKAFPLPIHLKQNAGIQKIFEQTGRNKQDG